MRLMLTIGCISLMSSAALAGPATSSPAQNGAVRMTQSQIAAHNSQLAATDPSFIKCTRMEGPGSFVKRKTCRTNEDWERRATLATQEARDIVDNIQLRGSSNSQEPPGSLFPMASVTPN